MQKYNDEQNRSGMRVLFMFVQMIILSVVYIIIYTSFKAVEYAIDKLDVSVLMYIPVVVAMVVFPILLYKYRQMFNAGKMLLASTWMMATAALTVILLYVYIAQITS
ncbi:MAG TPA: hypothetical protein ENK39_06215 [Epsilonproteobacteria bacterium]|nr:hypothetical protein [Campylobacterota bacterium]